MSSSASNTAAAPPRTESLPLGQELTEKLRAISGQYCAEEGGCHGPDHSERVHSLALHIGTLMQARLEVLSAAALLHDIGRQHETRSRGRICHARKGAEMAEEILRELGFPGEMRQEILHCIESHRYRNNTRPETLEARILFDADKLDSLGAIGIGRAFLFAGQVGARLHNQEADLAGTVSYSREDTAHREFQVKLRLVQEQMLTPEGRRLAAERHEFMEFFFKRLEREINGPGSSGPP